MPAVLDKPRQKQVKSVYVPDAERLKVFKELNEEDKCRLCNEPFEVRNDHSFPTREEDGIGYDFLKFSFGYCDCNNRHHPG